MFSLRIGIINKIALTLFVWGSMTTAAFAQTADLLVSPASGSYEVGKTFTVKIMAESAEGMNASEVEMSFDKDIVKIKSISKDGSAFSLWTQDPEFSNTAGTISFGGGSPGSFTGKRTLTSVVFEAKKEGSAKLEFTKGNLLAADGKGTDILGDMKNGLYTIKKASAVTPPKQPQQPVSNVPKPPSPEISVEGQDDPEDWYNQSSIVYEWEVLYGVTGVQTLFDQVEESAPTEKFEPPVAQQEITDLEEGIWYFHVQFGNKSGWGEMTHRILKIDLTPPEDFEVSIIGGDELKKEPLIDIGTSSDALSGLVGYQVIIDNGDPIELELADVADGTFKLPFQNTGYHSVIIKALDAAGNAAVAELDFETTAPAPEAEVAVVAETGGVPSWVMYILIFIIAFLLGVLYLGKKRAEDEREIIKREAGEVRQKLEGVFAVLRDEIEEQVLALATKPNMTESERQILEKMKEALEISEELLDKEIEDVRKLVN